MKKEYINAEPQHRPQVVLDDDKKTVVRAPLTEVTDGWVLLQRTGAGPIQHRFLSVPDSPWVPFADDPRYMIYPRERVLGVVG